jgi:3-deoxy-D-manno-octulosonic-acid transferase
MGELRKFYSLAAVVFVGRSLVPMGGSDPMEAAALGKPIIVGPYTDNFSAPVAALAAAEAVRIVKDADGLAQAVLELTGASQAGAGQRARRVVLDNQGATAATVERLTSIVTGWAAERKTA